MMRTVRAGHERTRCRNPRQNPRQRPDRAAARQRTGPSSARWRSALRI